LKEINGKPPAGDASLTIDGTFRGSGYSGCNTWSATIYPIKGQKLLMGPVVMTKKTCDAALTTFEKEYLTILHSGPTWDTQGDTLTVKGQTGTLVFTRSL
jgi:heat shock protein HslJ